MTDEQLPEVRRDHIVRDNLPWRVEQMTECGRPVSDVATAITREQAKWRVGKLGRERSAFTLCITCMQTANHAPAWDTRPAGLLSREMRRSHELVYRDYDRQTGQYSAPRVDRLGAELHAIAALIAAHPDEFAQLVTASTDAAMFAARRRQAERR